jgi:hypothetical protein
MIPHGKGKIAAIILARMKEKDSPKSEEERATFGRASDYSSDKADSKPQMAGGGRADTCASVVDPGMESAMEDFATALKADDPAGMARALCDFIHCHDNSEDQAEAVDAEDD